LVLAPLSFIPHPFVFPFGRGSPPLHPSGQPLTSGLASDHLAHIVIQTHLCAATGISSCCCPKCCISSGCCSSTPCPHVHHVVLFLKLRLVKPSCLKSCLQHTIYFNISCYNLWGSCCEFVGEILTAVRILLLVLHCHLEFNLWGSFTLVGELYSFSCVLELLCILIRLGP